MTKLFSDSSDHPPNKKAAKCVSRIIRKYHHMIHYTVYVFMTWFVNTIYLSKRLRVRRRETK